MANVKLYNIKWKVDTAGPSPDCNERTEIFFFGCDRAMQGNPCKGCFNHNIWDNSVCTIEHSVDEMINNIEKFAPNKYITIGGGEPTAQFDALIELTEKLKAKGFHIMVYTWKSLKETNNPKFLQLIKNIDILVDGEFKKEECLYNEDKGDGFLSSVGSGNQIIWDCKEYNDNNINIIKGFAMRELQGLALDNNDRLIYFLKDKNNYKEVALVF